MLRKEESDRLLTLLDESIRQSRHSRRELERMMGLGQGYLGSLFKHRIQLRVAHVYAIAHALNLEPLSFFLRASPPKDPDWLLEQLGIRPGKGSRPPLPDVGESSLLNRPEVHGLVRATIRHELGRILEEQRAGEE